MYRETPGGLSFKGVPMYSGSHISRADIRFLSYCDDAGNLEATQSNDPQRFTQQYCIAYGRVLAGGCYHSRHVLLYL